MSSPTLVPASQDGEKRFSNCVFSKFSSVNLELHCFTPANLHWAAKLRNQNHQFLGSSKLSSSFNSEGPLHTKSLGWLGLRRRVARDTHGNGPRPHFHKMSKTQLKGAHKFNHFLIQLHQPLEKWNTKDVKLKGRVLMTPMLHFCSDCSARGQFIGNPRKRSKKNTEVINASDMKSCELHPRRLT